VTSGAQSYYVKPLEVGVILATVATDPGLDLSAANALNLDDEVPQPAPNGVGTKPTGTDLLFVEGQPVE
jgi:hypothetical protein